MTFPYDFHVACYTFIPLDLQQCRIISLSVITAFTLPSSLDNRRIFTIHTKAYEIDNRLFSIRNTSAFLFL